MGFLKKFTAIVGLLVSLGVLAGEDPDPVRVEPLPSRVIDQPEPVPFELKKSFTPPDYYNTELKLYPRNRIENIDDILKQIPANAISPFLSSPKVVNEEEFKKSPYVISTQEQRIIASTGEKIYVRSILAPQTLSYSVYRKGKPYHNPETKELLGYEALFLANAQLKREGDPATLMLTQSKREVRVGDRLMENPQQNTALNYFPKPPSMNIVATIISVLDGVSQIGKYNIVVLDKGRVDRLETGHLLDIYQRGRLIIDRVAEKNRNERVQLPEELAGTLMIFRVFDRVSYALIMKASQAIHILDKAKTPLHPHS